MFTEVKEMIDSTIYENGKGEVTAQNVNLAMHGIVDAAEEAVSTLDDKLNTETSNREALAGRVTAIEENGTGGGSQPVVLQCKMSEDSEGVTVIVTNEQKTHNAEVFKIIKDAHCLVNVLIKIEQNAEEVAGVELVFTGVTCIYYPASAAPEEMFLITPYKFVYDRIMLFSDGSIICINDETL